MANNAYCSIDQLEDYIDLRAAGMLSNDLNSSTPDSDRIQRILNDCADELEGHLAGRVALPLTSIPGMLTKWVAIKTIDRLYGRRLDRPKSLAADLVWCGDWAQAFDAGAISLPGINRATTSLSDQCIDKGIEHCRRHLTAGL